MKMLIGGVIVGLIVAGVGLGAVSMSPSVNADKVCADRFGQNWSGEQVDANWQNQSVTLECTNGSRVETIGVNVDVEVDS